FYRWLFGCIGGFMLASFGLMAWNARTAHPSPAIFIGSILGLCIVYFGGILALLCWFRLRESSLRREEGQGRKRSPAFEYRSAVMFCGWPLIHIRIGGSFANPAAVKAWIAVGDRAVGGLFAFGGLAMAPVAIGGISVGLVSFGG